MHRGLLPPLATNILRPVCCIRSPCLPLQFAAADDTQRMIAVLLWLLCHVRALKAICCDMPGRPSNGEALRKVHSRVRHFGEVGEMPVESTWPVNLLLCAARAHIDPSPPVRQAIELCGLLHRRTRPVGMACRANFLCLRCAERRHRVRQEAGAAEGREA